ncbi:MAG TPA: cupin domain-containing protein [Verrucomicrobiales bacterium]|nr:cupin domain-containing protein [Verrucomicrobiales bacterium]
MKCLDYILSPMGQSEFFSGVWDSRAIHIEGKKEKFRDLFGWASLNRMLNAFPAPHPSLKLFKHGKPVSGKDSIEIIRQTQKGATLILEDADRYDPGLSRFLDTFADEVGERLRFNLYLSYPDEQGYRLHYDTQDFFILQISGFKRWKVYGSTMDSPLFFQKQHSTKPPPEETLYLDCLLGPGDVLYCPRGHWHEAVAEKEPSMHLTLGMFVANGIDFLSWMVDELREQELCRRNFPILIGEQRADTSIGANADLRRRIAEMRTQVNQFLANPDALADFYRQRTAKQSNRNPFHFPFHLESFDDAFGPDAEFRRLPHATHLRTTRDSVELAFGGRLVRFPLKAAGAVARILEAELFTLRDLNGGASELTERECRRIAQVLAQEGLVAPVAGR